MTGGPPQGVADWQAIEADVIGLVRTNLPDLPADRRIDPDSRLLELGADSLVLVNLLVDLESEYDVLFPEELLSNSTFESVSTLVAALTTLLDAEHS